MESGESGRLTSSKLRAAGLLCAAAGLLVMTAAACALRAPLRERDAVPADKRAAPELEGYAEPAVNPQAEEQNSCVLTDEGTCANPDELMEFTDSNTEVILGGYDRIDLFSPLAERSIEVLESVLRDGIPENGVVVEDAGVHPGTDGHPVIVAKPIEAYSQIVAGTNVWLLAEYVRGDGEHARTGVLSAIVYWNLEGTGTLTDIDFSHTGEDWQPMR